MKKYLKQFIHRGFIFGGLGPIVYAIVLLIIHLFNVNTISDGLIIFKAIISTYVLAFIVSGISIVWQIDKLGSGFAVLIHGSTLYISYLVMYLINGWFTNNLESILIYSLVFIISYLIIWLVIYMVEKNRGKKLNSYLNKK